MPAETKPNDRSTICVVDDAEMDRFFEEHPIFAGCTCPHDEYEHHEVCGRLGCPCVGGWTDEIGALQRAGATFLDV